MTSEAVRELIEREIAEQWSLTNAHGCELRRCLVTPELRNYEDYGSGLPLVHPMSIIQLWLVLEEIPTDRTGYKIVFGEAAAMFGLAIAGTTGDIFLGFYGSFLDAYRGM